MQSYKKKKRNIQIFQIKTFKNRIDSIEDKKRPNFFRNFRLPVCEALRLPFPSEVPHEGKEGKYWKSRKFRREQQFNDLIFNKSEVPEDVKMFFLLMYRMCRHFKKTPSRLR